MFNNKIDKGVSNQYYIIPDSCFIQETRDFTKVVFNDNKCNLCGLDADICPCYKHIEILPTKLIFK
jgi:Pyruvate/2-oxoacid:ferredoxin oxidoreductase delta subunit